MDGSSREGGELTNPPSLKKIPASGRAGQCLPINCCEYYNTRLPLSPYGQKVCRAPTDRDDRSGATPADRVFSTQWVPARVAVYSDRGDRMGKGVGARVVLGVSKWKDINLERERRKGDGEGSVANAGLLSTW